MAQLEGAGRVGTREAVTLGAGGPEKSRVTEPSSDSEMLGLAPAPVPMNGKNLGK